MKSDGKKVIITNRRCRQLWIYKMDKIENDINVFNTERTFYKEESKDEPKKVGKVCPICGKTLLINFEEHLQKHFDSQTSVNNNKTKGYRSSNIHKYNKDWVCPYCQKEMYGNETMFKRHFDYCKMNPNRKERMTSKEYQHRSWVKNREKITKRWIDYQTNPKWLKAKAEGRKTKAVKLLPPKLVKKAREKNIRILRRDIRYVEWQAKVMKETKRWAAKHISNNNFHIERDKRIRLAKEAWNKVLDWKKIPGNEYRTVLDIYPQWWQCKYVLKYYDNPKHATKKQKPVPDNPNKQNPIP